MEGKSIELAPLSSKEIKIPHPLVEELLAYAEKRFGKGANGSFDDYTQNHENPGRTKLSEKFAPLSAGDDSERYFLVYYLDRRDPYYAEGTRFRSVGISTQETKGKYDERLREVSYKQQNGDVFVTIEGSVNERAFRTATRAGKEKIVAPHGGAKATYKLVGESEKKLIEFSALRMDEVSAKIGQVTVPARWVRNLLIEPPKEEITYGDTYILGRASDPRSERRANITFSVSGTLESPKSIMVSIGEGPPSSARVLFEDKENNVKILVHKSGEEQLELLRMDSSYEFLNKDDISGSEIMEIVLDKIRQLQDHWDKPQSIFAEKPAIEERKRLEQR